MKVMVMTDLEGVSGVNGRSDGIGNKTVNLDAACRLLTAEVNAVVEGLVQAGADEVIVADGHGGSNSIAIEALHPAASLRIYGGGLCPVTSLDASFDAQVFLGAHAMSGCPAGFMNHSFNSHAVTWMTLNGAPIGEIGIEVLLAAYFGAPTILVTGDEAACSEAVAFLGNVSTVCTKWADSRYSVVNRNPKTVHEEMTAAARDSLTELPGARCVEMPSSFSLDIGLMCNNMADNYEKGGAERIDSHTIRYTSDDFLDLWARRNGWAAGVHNPRFGITPTWRRQRSEP